MTENRIKKPDAEDIALQKALKYGLKNGLIERRLLPDGEYGYWLTEKGLQEEGLESDRN